MSTPGPRHLDQLHYLLLHLLAEHNDSLTTSELRCRANELASRPRIPLVNETIYRTLRTLQRLGQVTRVRTGGRHALWSLTPNGAHTARQRISPTHNPQDQPA